MRITSIRARLTIWNVGILAVGLLAVLLAVNLTVRSYLVSNIDQRLERTSTGYERMMTRRRTEQRPASNHSSDSDRPSRPRLNFGPRLFDLQGHLMTRNWEPAAEQESSWDSAAFAAAVQGRSSFTTVESEESVLRVYTHPLTRDGQQIGVVQAVFSLHEVQVLLDGLNTVALILVPCVLLLAAIGGLFLTNRTLRPVREIARTASALNANDLSQRLPVLGADEFAHLAQTMNGMLSRLEEAFVRLVQSIERERRFTADASHELRTPLAAIKANASLALRGERTSAEYREALQAIEAASDTMQHIVRDLLLLARSHEGQLDLQFQAVDPRQLLEESVSAVDPVRGQARVGLTVTPESGKIWGDAQYLQRLVANLLENALRHTPPEGEVNLEAHAEDQNVILTVADTGEGIVPEHLDHLGEPFYRTDASRAREHGGTGLGLAICRGIVEAHHGTMAIESTIGQGTRVTLTLPMAQDAPPAE